VVDFGVLIIPNDIVTATYQSSETTGWLSGSMLEFERLFLVTIASIGATRKVSSLLDDLVMHRAYQPLLGAVKDNLLKWVKVETGFSKSFGPFRPHDTAELAAKLFMTAEELAHESSRYICVVEPGEKGPIVRAFMVHEKSGTTLLYRMDTVIVPESPAPFSRIPAELIDTLSNKRVDIVGLGSGGSEIALNLACAGVGFLDFFDEDRLQPENYIRHVLNRRDLGRNKVSGLLSDLRDRNLPTSVEIENIDVIFFADFFRGKLSENSPDLLICATDSRDSRRFLNACAVALRIPLIIAGILDAGRIGEAILILPYESACYECIRLELGTALEPSDSGDRPNTPYLSGEPIDLQAAVQRFDIDFVASLATRLALQVLDSERYPRLPTEYLVWGREKSNEHASPFSFDYPLSVNFVKTLRRADCPVCGDLATELEGIDIDERYEQIITELGGV
jgi:molybdopterin/thiamine biosynthesis adenylyltransferase